MAEQERKTSAEGVGEAPQNALSEVIQKLNISPETEKEIQTLSQDEKEELQVLFARIWKEVETQKLGPTDKERKIKNTLAEKYGIIIRNNKVTNTQGNIETVTGKTSIESVNHKILSEKLDAVKDLNQKVVSEELKKAKAEKPILPEETKLAIAKATNTNPSQVDEAIKKGDNPQIQNLVDTYYLTNAKVQSAIESRLPEEEKGKSYVAFQELRGSAREFGVLSPFTATDLPSRLSDKSDKTQQEVISTFNSINKDNPNTLITRTGDKLTWDGAREGEKFEIDMSIHPPKLSKSQGNLSISRTEVPENPELKSARESLDKSKNAYQEASKDIHGDLKNAGYYQSLDNFSLEEVKKAFSGEQFDVYREKIRNVRTLEEQEKLQQEIQKQGKQSEGKLTKVGFAYMDKILGEKIGMRKIGIENADQETATEQDLNNKLHILENLKSSDKLTKYTETRRKYEKENEAIKKMETPGVDTFSENASETLSLLNSLGYGELGQQGLDELLEAMNLHNKGTVESIDLDRNPKLDPTQERILRELAEKLRERSQQGETKVALQQLGTALKNQSFRAQHWNTREQREQFLFPNSKVGNSPKTPSEAQK